MRTKLVFSALVALGLLMAMPDDAFAQYYHAPRPRYGFRHRPHTYFGGNLMGFARAHDTNDPDMQYLGHGAGGGLTLGFRMSPWLALEGNLSFAYHNERYNDGSTTLDALWMSMLSVDAKVHIPTYGPIEPYLQAGIGYAYLGAIWPGSYGDEYSDAFTSGPVFNLGGGADLWLGPNLTVGARMLYRGIYFAQEPHIASRTINSSFVSGLTFDINAAIHF